MKMKNFKILQVREGLTRKFGYMGLNFWRETKVDVDVNNYDVAFTGKIEGEPYQFMLEKLFQDFNINHPKYYGGRSLSVGDIVEIDGNLDKIHFYCDSFGWYKIILKDDGTFII